ncbi:EutN/CcmL family microcompartment protein [Clostridiaceae bacterium M8S5]|nr:EutN/CcmL family microcompartment protein [Clostridiaceae bacterium M8S5]
MILGKVVGNVWATRKEEGLTGLKLLVVKPIDYYDDRPLNSFVATDSVGAGIGDTVLVVKGSSARKTIEKDNAPIDASIIGIIDEIEIDKNIELK